MDDLLERLPPLLAEIQSGVMARSLVIALVVVAPFWFVLRRRMRRDEAPVDPPSEPAVGAAPALEDLIERIAAMADAADGHGTATVEVPHGLTIDGDPAPDAVVDAIVRDAIARSGMVPTAELDTAEGRIIECQLRAGSSS